jgi:hypothetical protein
MPTLHKRFFVKTTFGREWEPFWEQIWGLAEQALQSSDKIVLIGYSMPTADEAARTVLFNTPNKDATITICSGSRSADIRDELASHGFKRLETFRNGLFEEFLAS